VSYLTPKLRLGILFSGRGSNMMAVLDAISRGEVHAEVVVALTNNPQAPGIALAESAGVSVKVEDPKQFGSIANYEAAMRRHLEAAKVDWVVLAGYMKVLGPTMLGSFAGRMINIHPSLLPAFKGLNAQRQAIEAGVKETGCTVHFVTAELDSGPVLLQAAVPVLPGDTQATLSDRILAEEHKILPRAIQLLTTQPHLFHKENSL
jgi:phosphoribosylglycinamide formyltransferase-1